MSIKKHTITFLGMVLLACISLQVNAQSGKVTRANEHFEKEAYPEAIRLYEYLLEKGEGTPEMRANLAKAYEETGQYQKAEVHYGLLAVSPDANPQVWFDYGRMLKANGKYDEAMVWFEKYRQTGDDNILGMKYKQSCEFAQALQADSGRYEVLVQPFSNGSSDFGPHITRTGIMFTSSRDRGFFVRVFNPRSNDFFYDMYVAERTGGESGWDVDPVKGKVNSKYHEGPGVLSPDGSVLYFTRSNFKNGKRESSDEGKNYLKIFSAQKSGDKWVDIEELSFNNDEYSVGHPALNLDGTMMIFSSDMPGGFGGSDLYMVKKEGDAWGEPENLGPTINTTSDELFPTISTDGSLFFSSDGHMGMGGLDIFMVKKENGRWGDVRNAGFPLNSSTDDFGVAFIKGKAKGYFSSDRDGGSGKDDIYSFSRKMAIEGMIVDEKTLEPIPGAKVVVMDASNNTASYVADDKGEFIHFAEYGLDYFITVEAEEYKPGKSRVSTRELGPLDDAKVRIALERDVHFDVSGTVTEAETGEPLDGANVRIRKTAGEEKIAYTDASGNYEAPLEWESEYTLVVEKDGYIPQVEQISTEGRTETELFRINVVLREGRFMLIDGQVVRKSDQVPLAGVKVHSVALRERKELMSTNTNRAGRFTMVLDPNIEQFLLVSSAKKYFTARLELPVLDSTVKDTTLYPVIEMVPWEVGQVVKTIYYDYDKSNIRRDASQDLFEIVYFMKDNPEASVEMGSHTDSRGSVGYNQKLSQRRSDAAVQFILEQGIVRERIESFGYGETQLVNRCSDDVECSEEEHQNNRRTELIITRLQDDDEEEAPMEGKDAIKEMDEGNGKDALKEEMGTDSGKDEIKADPTPEGDGGDENPEPPMDEE